MKTTHALPAALAAALFLSACNQYTLNRESGDMDTGSFGNATMENTLLATGQIQPQMSHDKYDPGRAGTLLNGKYAAVIWQGYQAGATSQHAGTAATTGADAAQE
jgi:hypothetical protein